MNILSWFLSSWPDMGLDEPVDLDSWRNWFLKIAVISGVFFTPFALIATFPVYLADGRYHLIALDCVVWLVIISRLFSKAESYKVNAYLILILLYFSMISFFIELGPVHARSAWLVACAVIATLLFGKRGAIMSTCFNIIILIILYWLIGPENEAWAAEHELPSIKKIMFIVNASVITIIPTLLVGFMLDRLDRSLRHETNTAGSFSRKRKD